ncbi:MAG: hypothetical protein L6Q99_07665 [Planctomycetes bacterium]|nr:hypothetical protein [Planctomycetota bacterium]
MTHVHLAPEAALELALLSAADARREPAEACADCRALVRSAAADVASMRSLFVHGPRGSLDDRDVRTVREVLEDREVLEVRDEREVRGDRDARETHGLDAARIARLVDRTLRATTQSAVVAPIRARRNSRRAWWIAACAAGFVAAALTWRWFATQSPPPAADAPLADALAPQGQSKHSTPAAPQSEPAPRALPTPGVNGPGDTVADALDRDRQALDRALRAPAFADTVAVRRPGEILACRVARWRGADCGETKPAQTASGIEAVLWAETLLDDFVRDARASVELAPLLSTCRRLATSTGPEAELARLTVARAARYGILGAPGRNVAAEGPNTGRTSDSDSEAEPFDPRWFAALSTAVVAASAQDDPTVRAWLAYGEPTRSAR